MPNGPQAAAPSAGSPTQHTPNSNTYGYSREEQIAALRKLREPFDPSEIRYLPRVWCRACKNSSGQGCNHHRIVKCNKCNQKMPDGGHIDLAFVGHAEATNRLLNVDPFWDWEPLTVDERGLPHVDGYRGLWIRLTVCGMTRLGYGHAGDKTGGDAVKEVIGDAIRNAGMRFGMALDLWTSSDLQIIESGGDGEEQAAAPARAGKGAARGAVAAESAAGPGSDPVQDALLDKLVGQVQTHWNQRDVLVQVRGEAEAKGLLARSVQGPDRAWVPFSVLLDNQIKALGGAAGGEQRSAA